MAWQRLESKASRAGLRAFILALGAGRWIAFAILCLLALAVASSMIAGLIWTCDISFLDWALPESAKALLRHSPWSFPKRILCFGGALFCGLLAFELAAWLLKLVHRQLRGRQRDLAPRLEQARAQAERDELARCCERPAPKSKRRSL